MAASSLVILKRHVQTIRRRRSITIVSARQRRWQSLIEIVLMAGCWTRVRLIIMCPELSRFENYSKWNEKRRITITSEEHKCRMGRGNINILSYDGKEWCKRVLVDALNVPESKYNLFFLTQSLDKGCEMTANKSGCVIMRDNATVAVGERAGNLIQMKLIYNSEESYANVAAQLSEWHRRLTHQGVQHVEAILHKCGGDYVKDGVCQGQGECSCLSRA